MSSNVRLTDILGTNRDQCVSMVQYCFTSAETVMLVRTGSPEDGQLDFHTAPELCLTLMVRHSNLSTGRDCGTTTLSMPAGHSNSVAQAFRGGGGGRGGQCVRMKDRAGVCVMCQCVCVCV